MVGNQNVMDTLAIFMAVVVAVPTLVIFLIGLKGELDDR